MGRQVWAEFRGIWNVTLCISVGRIYSAGQGRKGTGVKPLKGLNELTHRGITNSCLLSTECPEERVPRRQPKVAWK